MAKNENILLLSGSGWEISSTPEAQKLKLSLLKESAKIKQVSDDQSSQLAAFAISNLASFRKTLEATRKQVKEPVLRVGREIDTVAEAFGREVLAEESRIKAIQGQYVMKVEAEKRRLEQEAEKLRLEALQKEIEAEEARAKAEKTGSVLAEAKAAKLENQETELRADALTLEVKAQETHVRGGSTFWDYKVDDIHALYASHPRLVKLEDRRRDILEVLAFMAEKGEKPELPGITTMERPKVRAF